MGSLRVSVFPEHHLLATGCFCLQNRQHPGQTSVPHSTFHPSCLLLLVAVAPWLTRPVQPLSCPLPPPFPNSVYCASFLGGPA